ncbi:MAG: hypothetical protein JNM69_06035 [Archangium sp.]|nr:hypothetical protein [Archangium sp.]
MAPPKDQKQGQAGASSRQLDAVPERRSTGQIPIAGGKSPTGQIPVQGGASKQSLPQVAGKSTNGLPQVPARSPTGQIPVQGGNSKASLPQVAGKSQNGLPQVGAKPTRTTTGQIPIQSDPATSGPHPMPGVNAVSLDPSQVNKARLTEVQKIQNNDAFASWGAQRKRANFIATPTDPGSMKAIQEEEWIDPDYNPDGSAPLPECLGRETWRALKAPFTSKEGKRTKEAYEQAFKQFAIGFNDRYDEDAPGKPRGHIYVWDVSRAMNCEIPHFAGARELSLAQTVDWLKHEGPMRGWLKVPELDAPGLANKGLMVVVIPREVKLRQMAIVTPQDPKGGLLLTGAGLVVGADVPLREMLGTAVVDCYYHP